METYKLLSGEDVQFVRPKGPVGSFLRRVERAAVDPVVSVQEITDLVYGTENPMLDVTSFPGRAVVTRAVHENPVWWVLQDLIGRKRVATGHLDLAAARARYTMTVPQAAERHGVHESAIRQAIAARRLPAWKDGGNWMLAPSDVEAFRVARRGPKPRAELEGGAELAARVGSAPGVSFRVKGASVDGEKVGDLRDGKIPPGWSSIGVLVSKGQKARFFRLEPSPDADEVALEGFYLRGPFKVAETINNARRAGEAFKSFGPA